MLYSDLVIFPPISALYTTTNRCDDITQLNVLRIKCDKHFYRKDISSRSIAASTCITTLYFKSFLGLVSENGTVCVCVENVTFLFREVLTKKMIFLWCTHIFSDAQLVMSLYLQINEFLVSL